MGNTDFFKGADEKLIYYQKWISDAQPKAIVQISHGMAEHIGRYDEFAKFLVLHDIFVFGNDHRGHGYTETTNEDRGYFADHNGFEIIVDDMLALTNIIKQEYPTTPLFLFGHSMGSFLSRRFIQKYGKYVQGVIFSGTGGHPGLLGKVGHYLAAREGIHRGRRIPSEKLNKLTFGSFNNAFKPARTEFDWLSRDNHEVDNYINDPLCGGIFSAGFFEDFLKALLTIYDEDYHIPKHLPIYFLSGDQDPVGKKTRGVLQSYRKLRSARLTDVSYKFYPGARHEILNETNKYEVFEDIFCWISNKLNIKEG